MEGFSESDFEQKLFQLKDTHDSISSLSSWCLQKEEHHEKIVGVWLNILKRVKTEHRVLMFYLANDIVQYSKKKSLPFLDSFAPALQKATTMVRDESIRNKILRLFKIWDERNIYDESFLVDLSNLLTRGPKSVNRIDVEDFQPNILYSRLRSCQVLEEDTDAKMKILVESHISLTDVDKMRTSIKDRQASEDVVHEVDEGIKKITAFISSLEAEIKERIGLIDLLEIGEQFYEKEMGEAKIVVNAYKCFTNRVKTVKRKLEEKVENLPSPVPSPQADAPSPSPEPEKLSGGDMTFDFTPGGSFMDGSLLVDENLAKQFEEFSNKRPDTTADVSLASSNDSFTQPAYFPTQIALTNPPPPPPPIVVPPDKNDFISEVLPSIVDQVSSTTQNSIYDVSPTSLPLNTSKIPEPVPPVHRPDRFFASHFSDETSTTDSIAAEGNKIEVISSLPKPLSLSSLLESMVPSSVGSSLPPPPALPTELQMVDSSQAWPDDIPPDWESPESPPHYEKEAFPAACDVPIISQDVDMRCHDIDHRNLISLTGGSGPTKWSQSSVTRSNDNVDNVDMEMSDEEEKRNENDSGYSETASKNSSVLNGVVSKKSKMMRNGQSDGHQKNIEFRPIETLGYSSAKPILSLPLQKYDGTQSVLKPLTPAQSTNDSTFKQGLTGSLSMSMTPEALPSHDFFIGGSNSPVSQPILQNPSSPCQYPQSGSKMYQLPPPPPPPPMPAQFLDDSKDLSYWRNSSNFNLPPPHQFEPRSLPPPPPPPPHFATAGGQPQFIHRENGPLNNSPMNGSHNGPVRYRPGFRSYRPRFNRY